MNSVEIIEMARQAGFEDFVRWSERYPHEVQRWVERMEAFAKLIAAKEREAIQELLQHEDVLAPVGNSAWGEAYQEGWASGTRAYLEAIQARGEA